MRNTLRKISRRLARALSLAAGDTASIAHARVARATERLDAVIRFYRDGLGLAVIDGFEGHEGYDGVMLGLPGAEWHLEFTRHAMTPAGLAPGPESLLVLYYPSVVRRDEVARRLERMGFAPARAENPYWRDRALTYLDPDGYWVALFNGAWIPSPDEVPMRWRSAP